MQYHWNNRYKDYNLECLNKIQDKVQESIVHKCLLGIRLKNKQPPLQPIDTALKRLKYSHPSGMMMMRNSRSKRKKTKWKWKINFIMCLEILDLNAKTNNSLQIYYRNTPMLKRQSKLIKTHTLSVSCTLNPNKCVSHKVQH